MINSKLDNKIELVCQRLVETILEVGLEEFSFSSANLWNPYIIQIIDLIDEDIKSPFKFDKDCFFSKKVQDYILPQVNKHKFNGTPFKIFATILKLQKKVLIETIYESNIEKISLNKIVQSINSIFDQIDIVIGEFWIDCNCNCSEHIKLLENRNINNVKKKNEYINIFESIPCPLIVLENSLDILNVNLSAYDFLSKLELEDKYFKILNYRTKKAKILNLDFTKLLGSEFEMFVNSSDVEVETLVILDNIEIKLVVRKIMDITGEIDGFLCLIEDR